MSDKTGIEWTDATWNPVTGCTKVSPGCDHCYAETFAERWRGTPGHHFEQGFDVTLRPERLDQPLKWKKPRRIFVNSMSDLFHEAIPDEFIADVWHTMAEAPQHTFQILTKRHGRMRSWVKKWCSHPAWTTPLPNVWLGCSVEDQRWADIRIPALLDTPAAVRFISAEPLLGAVQLTHEWLGPHCRASRLQSERTFLDWVIVGGESGPGARLMDPEWARSLRDQCTRAGVAYLFKQWGEWAPTGRVGIGNTEDPLRNRLVGEPDDRGFREEIRRVGKKSAGRELDGRTWDEYPGGAL